MRRPIGAILCSTAPCLPESRLPRRAHQRRIGCCDKWLVEFEREAMAAGILQLPSRRGALPHLRSAHREELLMTEPAKSIVQADFNGVYLLID
jgi:hypothetical protein